MVNSHEALFVSASGVSMTSPDGPDVGHQGCVVIQNEDSSEQGCNAAAFSSRGEPCTSASGMAGAPRDGPNTTHPEHISLHIGSKVMVEQNHLGNPSTNS